jgi:CDGSH-type Zn-finger protein
MQITGQTVFENMREVKKIAKQIFRRYYGHFLCILAYILCRLGLWSTKVFCLGSHLKVLIYIPIIIWNAPHNRFLRRGSL